MQPKRLVMVSDTKISRLIQSECENSQGRLELLAVIKSADDDIAEKLADLGPDILVVEGPIIRDGRFPPEALTLVKKVSAQFKDAIRIIAFANQDTRRPRQHQKWLDAGAHDFRYTPDLLDDLTSLLIEEKPRKSVSISRLILRLDRRHIEFGDGDESFELILERRLCQFLGYLALERKLGESGWLVSVPTPPGGRGHNGYQTTWRGPWSKISDAIDGKQPGRSAIASLNLGDRGDPSQQENVAAAISEINGFVCGVCYKYDCNGVITGPGGGRPKQEAGSTHTAGYELVRSLLPEHVNFVF
jgi:hypothetical protein